MTLSIKDTMHFGKHKGMNVGRLLLENPEYACWLREEKRKQDSRDTAFDNEANDMIDVAIDSSRSLRKRYAKWGMGEKAAMMKSAAEAAEKAAADEVTGRTATMIITDEFEAAVEAARATVPTELGGTGTASFKDMVEGFKKDASGTTALSPTKWPFDVEALRKADEAEITRRERIEDMAAKAAELTKLKDAKRIADALIAAKKLEETKEVAYAGDWGAW